ncbi:molt-inhibiting hormone-like [Penaeus chinensis]|uniref:molt-inhibiting hormone-like n=1 Tax=Penaeus chinensis TaxID=139456 RepID=UPI001FB5BF38|nr:molt-inhibiting hormone-like [Penaeus chinensis]
MRCLAMSSWLAIMIVLLGTNLFGIAPASPIHGTCRGRMGNRELYKKVDRVCEDCANIFRVPGLEGLCRDQCFYNEWFLLCLKAANREDEINNFRVWISILNA